jgi:hypothetical protein
MSEKLERRARALARKMTRKGATPPHKTLKLGRLWVTWWLS